MKNTRRGEVRVKTEPQTETRRVERIVMQLCRNIWLTKGKMNRDLVLVNSRGRKGKA